MLLNITSQCGIYIYIYIYTLPNNSIYSALTRILCGRVLFYVDWWRKTIVQLLLCMLVLYKFVLDYCIIEQQIIFSLRERKPFYLTFGSFINHKINNHILFSPLNSKSICKNRYNYLQSLATKMIIFVRFHMQLSCSCNVNAYILYVRILFNIFNFRVILISIFEDKISR